MQVYKRFDFTFTGCRADETGIKKFYSVPVIAVCKDSAIDTLNKTFNNVTIEKVVNRSQTDDYLLGCYQSKINDRYFLVIYKNGGNLWDSLTCEDVAPNETTNSKELLNELMETINTKAK